MSPLHMRSQVCMERNNFTVQCRLCTAHGREQCWHKFSLNWSTMVTNAIICTHTNFLKHPIWVKSLKEHSGYENSNDHNMEPILQDLILLTIVYFYSGRPVKIVWELSRPLWFSAPRNVWTPPASPHPSPDPFSSFSHFVQFLPLLIAEKMPGGGIRGSRQEDICFISNWTLFMLATTGWHNTQLNCTGGRLRAKTEDIESVKTSVVWFPFFSVTAFSLTWLLVRFSL